MHPGLPQEGRILPEVGRCPAEAVRSHRALRTAAVQLVALPRVAAPRIPLALRIQQALRTLAAVEHPETNARLLKDDNVLLKTSRTL